MIRRNFIWGATALSFLALLIMLGGCTVTVTVPTPVTSAPTGSIIDATLGAGVSSATVQLQPLPTGTPLTATTNTSGAYAFSGVSVGKYELSASLTGYVFIKLVVDITGATQVLPNLPGFVYNAATDATNIMLITMWDPSFNDVDAYLSFPGLAATTTGTAPAFTTPYAIPGAGALGVFSPETGARPQVYYGRPTTAVDSSSTWNSTTFINTLNKGTKDYKTVPTLTVNDSYMIELDVDNSGASTQAAGGPETITIRTFPFNDAATNSSTVGGVSTGLPALTGGNYYTWVGVMQYYIDAAKQSWSGNSTTNLLSTQGTAISANALTYVLQGGTLLGVYTVPTYTDVKTASMLRINCFYKYTASTGQFTEFYQIVPDIQVLQGTGDIRALNPHPSTIVVEGRTRR